MWRNEVLLCGVNGGFLFHKIRIGTDFDFIISSLPPTSSESLLCHRVPHFFTSLLFREHHQLHERPLRHRFLQPLQQSRVSAFKPPLHHQVSPFTCHHLAPAIISIGLSGRVTSVCVFKDDPRLCGRSLFLDQSPCVIGERAIRKTITFTTPPHTGNSALS